MYLAEFNFIGYLTTWGDAKGLHVTYIRVKTPKKSAVRM